MLTGLVAQTLATGRVDPLDWLLPGMISVSVAVAIRRERTLLFPLLQVAVPVLLLVGLAAHRLPLAGLTLLTFGLVVAAALTHWSARQPPMRRIGAILCLLGLAWLATRPVSQARNPAVDVSILSGPALQGVPLGRAMGRSAADSIGLVGPLWLALSERLRLHPLDAIDSPGLTHARRLILIQPRALSPSELVALDAWVRGGGRAVILADPLLHWHDPRPIADPARAPITSLLDPLLSHWGLVLASARPDDRTQRRFLQSGALIQLLGAASFELTGQSPSCRLEEGGLIAQCRVGGGHALLIADADWADDPLWTLRPDRPGDRRARTSDAPDLLADWITDERSELPIWTSWLRDEEGLRHALRLSLIGLLALLVGDLAWQRRPSLAANQKKIINGTKEKQHSI